MLSKSSLGEGYSFHATKQRPSIRGGLLLSTRTYRFKTRLNRIYLAEVEYYRHDIFIIKFYLKNHRGSKRKFNLTTKSVGADGKAQYDGDGWRIITTCLRIMLAVRAKFPLMSCGFIGAELEGESKDCTKRFRVWSKVVLAFFDPEQYTHHSNSPQSAYFIECNANPEPDLLTKAVEMFEKIYLGVDGLLADASTIRVG